MDDDVEIIINHHCAAGELMSPTSRAPQNSVLSAFSCSLLDLIQLATAAVHSETDAALLQQLQADKSRTPVYRRRRGVVTDCMWLSISEMRPQKWSQH